MNIDKTFLSKFASLLIAFCFTAVLFLSPNSLSAEGSVDFLDYEGYRLFYFAERPQQLKVYAGEGEFLNFGASHVGISSGFIKIYRPDGSLHSTYNNTGTTEGLGIINNNVEELNGPTGGGSTSGTGYIPGIVEVDPGEAGVWTITLGYGFYQNSSFENLLNNEAWTRDIDQPTNRRVVLSWDITVSQSAAANDGGNMLEGRVFTNEYQSIVSGNGITTSPTFYLLTNEGNQFQINYQEVDPWGFQINSNNKGITTGDNIPTYASFDTDEVTRSADIGTFDANQFYLYEPQARDISGIVNNKVFFNLPDPNMPATAMVTDIVREDSHTTWLYREAIQYDIEILDVNLLSNDPVNSQGFADALDRNNGAIITYRSNLAGNAQLVIDLDNDGIFGNNNDRIVNALSVDGENQILWDGLDRVGNELPQQFNLELAYELRVNAGELHLTLSDIENDLGGVRLTRLNGDTPNSQFLFDHSRIGGAISGDNTLAQPTSEPFIFSNNFGDLKMLDYWTYSTSVSAISELLLDVVDDITFLAPDTDGDGVRDDNDIDDDNDGILDVIEACPESEGNSCMGGDFDPAYDEDFDGIPNYMDASDPAFDLACADNNGDGICDNLILALDADQDGVPNHLDLDADNDGIHDITEGGNEDPEEDGTLTLTSTIFANQFGLVTAIPGTIVPSIVPNKDTDGFPDFLDLDSDNDGINDVVEAGFIDADNDGRMDSDFNSFGQSILNNEIQSTSFPRDNDNDGVPNYHDLDSDNDGINDVVEGGNIDEDNDGIIGVGTPITNEDGQVIGQSGDLLSTSFPLDTDEDGIFDYEDLDSDNDGIFDVYEANLSDEDNDGIVGVGNSTVDENGQVILAGQVISTSNPLDTDQDGIPDFIDLDSDNDTLSDTEECPDGSPCPDVNQLGGPDYVEFNSVACPVPLPQPTVDDDSSICSNETLSLEVNESSEYETLYPSQDILYTWKNANGVVIGATLNPIFDIDGDDPMLILPLTIRVSIGSSCESIDSDAVNPEIKPTPVAVASADFESICTGGDIMLFAETVAGAFYQWDLDFGTTPIPFSNEQNPDLNNLALSTNFGLVVTASGCVSERDELLISVQEPATIEALEGNGTYCAGEDVIFTAKNNNPDLQGNLTYVFSGPDGLMVELLVPADGTFEYAVSSVDFVNGGTYSLFVDGGVDCMSNIESYSVAISEGPEQPNIAVSDDSVCQGTDITFTTQMYEEPNVSYVWMLDGVMVSTTTVPTFNLNGVSVLQEGNYSVEVITGSCGASTSEPVAISVVDTSVSPEVENNLTASACVGQAVNLRVINPTPETIYTWYNPDGVVIATDVLEVDILNIQTADAGIYLVEANIDGCVTLQDQDEILVSEGVATPEFVENNLQSCAGQDLVLSVMNITPTANTTFNWFDSNGILITQTNDASYTLSNVTAADNGTYYVIAEEGDCTSGASLEATVQINVPPSEIANAGLNTSFCSSESINLDATFPMEGTGVWMSTSTISITDINNPNTAVNNLSVGDNMFIWTLNANGCMDYSRDTVIINVSDVPNEIASIQNTETNICASDADALILSAFPPMEGAGEWSFVSGDNVIAFTTPNDATTGVENISSGSYVVRWSLSTADCGVFSENTYTFNVDQEPTDLASAGSDQTFCDGALVTTQASASAQGVGEWTSTSAAVFGNVNDPNTTVTGLSEGTNILTWSLSNGACENYNTDDVIIEISTSPTEQAMVVNNTINICEGNTLDLQAMMPNTANGAWSQISGPSAMIMNAASTQTGVNYSTPGAYTFAWQLSTVDCGTYSAAEVEVVVDAVPNEIADAGVDQIVCGTEITLSAGTVLQGEGFWISTGGDIVDPTDPNTVVTNVPSGSQAFTWILSNGSCQNYSSDEVMISVSDAPNEVAEVVNNQISLCADNSNGMTDLVAMDPTLASGAWSQMTGPNTATISNNTQAISSVSGLIAGTYEFSWSLSSGSCTEFSSAVVTVSVDELPMNILAEAGEDQEVCALTTTSLDADMPSVGTGRWSIFNTSGASVDDVMNPNSNVELVEGENIFIWSLSNGGCENYQTDTVSVFLTTPTDDAVIMTDDIVLCESDVNSITLIANNVNSATGVWTQTSGPNNTDIDSPNNEEINVSNFNAGEYTFQWTLSDGECLDFASDMVRVNISALPNEEANVAMDELFVCGENQVTIEAITPSQSNGLWTTASNVTIANPDLSSTVVSDLQAGANLLTWSLSNGSCQDFSQATVVVFVETGVDAVDDVYATTFGTAIQDENLLANENLNGNTDWTIELVGLAPEVTINTDGTFTFIPVTGFSGDYTFEYELCDMSCNTCERALVSIQVDVESNLLCEVPNVLTPNNDNKNDALIIDCTNQYENNIIQIFNRWGDKVHEKVTYQNDWTGTYDGEDLPAGTYFYVFRKDQDDAEAITGYITIIR